MRCFWVAMFCISVGALCLYTWAAVYETRRRRAESQKTKNQGGTA